MSDKNRADFSKRFRQALNEAGHKKTRLQDLGAIFDVSSQAVRKWLNCEALPNSSRAPLIALKLGVRRAWLLDGELPMRSIQLQVKESSAAYKGDNSQSLTISADEFQLLSNYRNLSKSLQKSLHKLLSDINADSR